MHAFQKKGAIPLYTQVADWIREQIYDGTWNYGEQIVSENQLGEMLKISRGTIKKAIAQLCEEGLLTQVQGKGTFVTDDKISYPMGKGLLSFAESMKEQNIAYTTKVLEKRFEQANAHIAQKLHIAQGDTILYLKRVRYVNEEPVMLIENRINIQLCPGLEEVDFTTQSLFDAVERISGRKIKFSEARYAARTVGMERAPYLDVHESAPVLHLEQIVHLDNDDVIDFGNVWLKSNRYYLGMIYRR